jgi:uncharacterized protein (UPF0548 family)
MWRTTPLHRREVAGCAADDWPPPLPAGVPADGLQPAEAGVGPLFRRRYEVRVRHPRLSPAELMAQVQADLNRPAPTEMARFSKVEGDKGRMAVGDEYVVRMPGPWDGPVRVVSVTPVSFRLATLDTHLEAGQIELRAGGEGEHLVFSIESWARSGDQLSRVLYQQLRMAKEVQLHMWTTFLERVVHLSGGRVTGGIDIDTRRVEPPDGGRDRLAGDPHVKVLLDQLHEKALNFDADSEQLTPQHGWQVDDYCQPLPPEPPGDPVAGGAWETARELIRDYQFADPSMIRAVYAPDGPLEQRDMLLEARFLGLRFRFGVRVGGVRDETREVGGRQARIWGWNYRTLQGHLEMGQMAFEVWKWLDTGDVEFRTCRVSRHAPVGNPVVRVGLGLFGRGQQVKFAHRACQRMVRLTEAAVGPRPDGDGRSGPRHATAAPMKASTRST